MRVAHPEWLLLIPLLGPEHAFSPYLVAAAGVNFARLRLVDSPDFTLDDSRLQAVAQVGGGFELRLSQRFSLQKMQSNHKLVTTKQKLRLLTR